MPQLLHYLKVDQQTRLSAPELPTPPAPGALREGEGGEGGQGPEEADPPAAVPQGGRAFFNQNETVRPAVSISTTSFSVINRVIVLC